MFEGVEEFQAALDVLAARVTAAGETIVERGAILVSNNARINVRRVFSSRQKGALVAAIQPTPAVQVGLLWTARVEAGKVYARIQEKGGTIVPKNAKSLSWIDPTTGDRIFAKSVTLPARPYLGPAFVTSAIPYRTMAKEVLTTVIEGAGG